MRYDIFAATTDIIIRFLLKCSEITAEGALKTQDMKLTDQYARHEIAGHENVEHEIAGHEIAGHAKAKQKTSSEAANVWSESK